MFDTEVNDGNAQANLTQPAQQALAKCMNELWVQLASGVEPSCDVVDEETQETRTVRWPAFSSSEPPAVAVFDSQNILSLRFHSIEVPSVESWLPFHAYFTLFQLIMLLI